jgi:hypothetical protein
VTAARPNRGGLEVPEPSQPTPRHHGLLAATAKVWGLILVTCNLAVLVRSDLRVLNPFDLPGLGK